MESVYEACPKVESGRSVEGGQLPGTHQLRQSAIILPCSLTLTNTCQAASAESDSHKLCSTMHSPHHTFDLISGQASASSAYSTITGFPSCCTFQTRPLLTLPESFTLNTPNHMALSPPNAARAGTGSRTTTSFPLPQRHAALKLCGKMQYTAPPDIFIGDLCPCPVPGLCQKHKSLFGKRDEPSETTHSADWDCEACGHGHPKWLKPAQRSRGMYTDLTLSTYTMSNHPCSFISSRRELDRATSD